MAKSNWNTSIIDDQTGKVVVITGATSGIGKETAKVLAGKNATVVIGARNLIKAESVVKEIQTTYPNANILVKELNLTSLSSVQAFSESILEDFDRLDVLINNAGIMACPHATTQDGFEIQMGTNHLAHFALTGRLMPLLKQTPHSRIVVLSSIGHYFGKIDLTDLNWESRPYKTNNAYADSKLANLYFMYELTRLLEKEGGSASPMVVAAHPGWTATELQRHSGSINFLNRFFAQETSQGALPTLRAGFDPNVSSGEFFGPSRFFELQGAPIKVNSNKLSHNTKIASQLWKQSEQLTGVCF